MSEEITVSTFEDAERLATASYWVESFYFSDTDQGETTEKNFNKVYQITDRNKSDLVHYSKMT